MSSRVHPTGAVVTQQTVAAEVPHDVQMELMLRNPSEKPAGLVMPHLAPAKDILPAMVFTSMTLYSKPDPVPPPAPIYAPPMVPGQVMQYAPPPPPATLAGFSQHETKFAPLLLQLRDGQLVVLEDTAFSVMSKDDNLRMLKTKEIAGSDLMSKSFVHHDPPQGKASSASAYLTTTYVQPPPSGPCCGCPSCCGCTCPPCPTCCSCFQCPGCPSCCACCQPPAANAADVVPDTERDVRVPSTVLPYPTGEHSRHPL